MSVVLATDYVEVCYKCNGTQQLGSTTWNCYSCTDKTKKKCKECGGTGKVVAINYCYVCAKGFTLSDKGEILAELIKKELGIKEIVERLDSLESWRSS